MKNFFLLKALFGAFCVLKLANIEPFSSWSWWLIAGVLALHYLRFLAVKFWNDLGLGEILDAEIMKAKYDILYRKEIKREKKELKNGK